MVQIKSIDTTATKEVETKQHQDESHIPTVSTNKPGDAKTQDVSTPQIAKISEAAQALVQSGTPQVLQEKSVKVHVKRTNGELQIKENKIKKKKSETKETVQVTKSLLSFESKKAIVLGHLDNFADELIPSYIRWFYDPTTEIKNAINDTQTWNELQSVLISEKTKVSLYKEKVSEDQHIVIDNAVLLLEKFIKEHAI